VTTYLLRFIYGSIVGAMFVLLLARWAPFHAKEVVTVVLATAILSIFLWDEIADLAEFVFGRFRK
jgi:hypothetical protein